MGKSLIACLLLTLIAQSFSLPLTLRSSIERGNSLSASVSAGIVIAIFVIFLIPLIWCTYRLGTTRTRQGPMPIYEEPPRMFPTTHNYDDAHSSISSSSQITRPHPVHHKVSKPTFRA